MRAILNVLPIISASAVSAAGISQFAANISSLGCSTRNDHQFTVNEDFKIRPYWEQVILKSENVDLGPPKSYENILRGFTSNFCKYPLPNIFNKQCREACARKPTSASTYSITHAQNHFYSE